MQPNRHKPGGGAILPAREADEPLKVMVIDADPALAELLEDWLGGEGCRMADARPDVVLVDLPFDRGRAEERMKALAQAYPHTPLLRMPKPLTREAFAAALRRAKDDVQ